MDYPKCILQLKKKNGADPFCTMVSFSTSCLQCSQHCVYLWHRACRLSLKMCSLYPDDVIKNAKDATVSNFVKKINIVGGVKEHRSFQHTVCSLQMFKDCCHLSIKMLWRHLNEFLLRVGGNWSSTRGVCLFLLPFFEEPTSSSVSSPSRGTQLRFLFPFSAEPTWVTHQGQRMLSSIIVFKKPTQPLGSEKQKKQTFLYR